MKLFIQNKRKLKCGSSLILFLVSFLLLESSCKKETLPDFLVPDSIRAYVSFKVGTYWIYKDDSTGFEDSIWVSKLKSTWDPKRNSDGDIIGNNEKISCLVNVNDSNAYNEYSADQTGTGYSLYDFGFGINFSENSSQWNNTVFYRDSIIVDTIRYDHVINLTGAENSIYVPYRYLDIYAKSGLGLLKWRVLYNDGHTRSQHLVRYSLVQ